MNRREIVKKLIIAGHKDLARKVLALTEDEKSKNEEEYLKNKWKFSGEAVKPKKFGIFREELKNWNPTVVEKLKDSGAKWTDDGWVCDRNDIDLSRLGLTKLPLFKKITVSFDCNNNALVSLSGLPKEIGGYFTCKHNLLTSLKGCPERIEGNFLCDNNKLTSLEGIPKEVGGSFSCTGNKKEFTEEEIRKVCDVKGDIIL